MNQLASASFVAVLLAGTAVHGSSVSCTPTGFFRDGLNMTAAVINPSAPVSGDLDATGCNVGVYFDTTGAGGTVVAADVHGANYFGVLVNGDAGAVHVDVLNSRIHDIGELPHNGTQHGVAIYYRGFSGVSNVTGRISGNQIAAYQKGGIVANGVGTKVAISGNVVNGDGDVTFIAQNGIQVGYGATASVMHNTVSGNSYTGIPGDGSASGGILVVGGPWYGGDYTANTRIEGNILDGNDVGIYLSNVDADGSAPAVATNVKAVNNTVTNDTCFNASYQAGISDVGNNDKMINNRISGPGYTSCTSGYTVDADSSFTNRPKVHAIKD